MGVSVEKWVDTHMHLGIGPEYGPADVAAGLMEVFDKEDVDLRFIVSAVSHWEEMIRDSADGVLEAHRLIHEVAERLPGKVYGSFMPNPHFLDACLTTMDQCFGKWGFVQLGEVVPYFMHHRINIPPMVKLAQRALEYDVPVHIHISTSNAKNQGPFPTGEDQLEDMLDLVERVPEAKYIVAHGIGAPSIHPPVVEKYLSIIDRRYGRWPDNLWTEIIHFHAAGVKSALSYIPSSRITSGTDWHTWMEPPYPPYGTVMGSVGPGPFPPCVESLINLLAEAGADENTIRQIGYQNAFELYGLEDIEHR